MKRWISLLFAVVVALGIQVLAYTRVLENDSSLVFIFVLLPGLLCITLLVFGPLFLEGEAYLGNIIVFISFAFAIGAPGLYPHKCSLIEKREVCQARQTHTVIR